HLRRQPENRRYAQYLDSPAGQKLAIVEDGLAARIMNPPSGGETAVYNGSGLNYIRHTDWLGSSRLATTWAHAVYSKEAYAPFGETYNEAGTPDRSFTGQDQDLSTGSGATGTYDFLFRKYDPASGRWLSPDPAGWGAVDQTTPQSLNRYAYVQNNPMSAIDPQGLDCIYAAGGGVSVDSYDSPQSCAYNGGNWYQGTLPSNASFNFGYSDYGAYASVNFSGGDPLYPESKDLNTIESLRLGGINPDQLGCNMGDPLCGALYEQLRAQGGLNIAPINGGVSNSPNNLPTPTPIKWRVARP
ncbi:MAG TPA: RHS repeat-associated core domain-containing protein, partial [Desulfobaccales bacterium]